MAQEDQGIAEGNEPGRDWYDMVIALVPGLSVMVEDESLS